MDEISRNSSLQTTTRFKLSYKIHRELTLTGSNLSAKANTDQRTT